MKDLIPRTFDELMAMSLTTFAVIAWILVWWHA